MPCPNVHQLLDLYFHEGNEEALAEVNAHASRCAECRMVLGTFKRTLRSLSILEEEEPPAAVLPAILEEVSASRPKQAYRRTGVDVVPVLQIAFGEILVFALIYFVKIQLSAAPIWEVIGRIPFLRSIGSVGVSVALVLLAGSFITLALAPVLLMDSKNKFSS
jgi:hypothetical protein